MIPFLISLVLFQWVEGYSTSPNEFIEHLICYSCVFLRAPQSDVTCKSCQQQSLKKVNHKILNANKKNLTI